ncbi:aminoglycoside 6-adenylyltransferase [Helicobacter burdigaliensis]|uniref:aminoglycoside 6-adenylyltransferase n=1 Tax=Helicobacter burdigaliensis TaxID=2315334 RepID=UPI001E64A3E4|nr:aminoglycoside 6-adenylyltransferase [Helicobacter burdigaliensis]
MYEFLEIKRKSNIKKAKIPHKILKFTKQHFGKIIFTQLPESMEFYPPDLPKNWVSFLMLFENGMRLDLKIIPLEDLELYYKLEPLRKAFFDRFNIFMQNHKKSPFSIATLTQTSFEDICNEFYFTLANLHKALLRKQFILANHLLSSMREALLNILSFKIGLIYGFTTFLGKEKTNLLNFLSQDEMKMFKKSYQTHSLKHIKNSSKSLEKLFYKTYCFIICTTNFQSTNYQQNILSYIKALKKL